MRSSPVSQHSRKLRTPVTAGLRQHFDIILYGMVLQMTVSPQDLPADLVAGFSRLLYVIDLAQAASSATPRDRRIQVTSARRTIDDVIEFGNRRCVYRVTSPQALSLGNAVPVVSEEVGRFSVEEIYAAHMAVEQALAAIERAAA